MIKVSWEPWELAVWEEMREARQEAAAAWLAESDLAGRWVGRMGGANPPRTGQHRLPGCEKLYCVAG